jgi:hypothetical protein
VADPVQQHVTATAVDAMDVFETAGEYMSDADVEAAITYSMRELADVLAVLGVESAG